MKFISQLIFVLLPAFIYAKCCYHTTVKFRIEGDQALKCTDFGAATLEAPMRISRQPEFAKYFYRACEKKVCGDGEAYDTPFCGKGACNLVGCGCQGGCIEGHPLESFVNKHGANVTSLGLSVLDTIINSVFNSDNN